MGAGLLDDALGKGDHLVGLLGVGVGPLEHLMAASVRHNETSHSTLLCRRWQPGRGTHAVPARLSVWTPGYTARVPVSSGAMMGACQEQAPVRGRPFLRS